MTLSVGKTRKYWEHYMFGGNREKAILRDGGKCVKCGMTREEHKKKYNSDISVDHINGKGSSTAKEKKDNRLENLQTLCLSCHGLKDVSRRPEKIVQVDWSGGVVNIFESIMDAERQYGFSNSKISRVLHGYRHHHQNYFWYYLDEFQGKTI